MGGKWLTYVAAACALISSDAALAVSIPAALALLAMAAWAPGVVTAIAAAHRQGPASPGHEAGTNAVAG
jgi:hypothetical protein